MIQLMKWQPEDFFLKFVVWSRRRCIILKDLAEKLTITAMIFQGFPPDEEYRQDIIEVVKHEFKDGVRWGVREPTSN